MKVVVIGASGTIGGAVADALDGDHEVVRVSRNSKPPVDLRDRDSIASLFRALSDVDAVICCAASAPLTPLSEPGFLDTMQAKLLGQIEVVRQATEHLRDRGSITVTSGKIPEATPGSAGGALVNAGLGAFVKAAAIEMPRGIRLNAVSPGWVAETLRQMGMDDSEGTPAATVASGYVQAAEGSMSGETLTPS